MPLSDERRLLNTVSIGTDARGHKLAFPDDVVTTYNTAFGAASAKVPVAEASRPATSAAAGRAILEVAGSTLCELMFFGTDADNETGAFRVTAWSPLELTDKTIVFVPKILMVGTLTLGAGVATAIVASGFVADTVAVTTDLTPSSGGALEVSPGGSLDNAPASLVFDHGGAAFLELELTRNGLTAASLGALYRPY